MDGFVAGVNHNLRFACGFGRHTSTPSPTSTCRGEMQTWREQLQAILAGYGAGGGAPGFGEAVTRCLPFLGWTPGNHFQLCLGLTKVTAEGKWPFTINCFNFQFSLY